MCQGLHVKKYTSHVQQVRRWTGKDIRGFITQTGMLASACCASKGSSSVSLIALYLLLFTVHCPVQICQTGAMDFLFLTAQTRFFLLPHSGPTIPAPSHRNPKLSSVSSYLCLFILLDFPPHLAALTLYSIIWQTCIEFPPYA